MDNDNHPTPPVSESKNTNGLWNAIKSIGPFLLTQFDATSQRIANHEMRLAQVAVYKEQMIMEIRSLNDLRSELKKKFFEAQALDRININRDIELIEKELRKLRTYGVAIEKLSTTNHEDTSSATASKESDTKEITPTWKEKFDEWASKENEDWRNELLAKALAREASMPGSISTRLLWTIGTYERRIFDALSVLIDSGIFIGQFYILPNQGAYLTRILPKNIIGEEFQLGQITFMLNETGILAPMSTSQISLKKEQYFTARTVNRYLTAKPKSDFTIGGICLTYLGSELAALYEPNESSFADTVFDDWRNQIQQMVDITY